VEARVLSTLLNEMDGVASEGTDALLVVAATNRPQALDAALLRPGRFDTAVHVSSCCGCCSCCCFGCCCSCCCFCFCSCLFC
jgi:hypothetical protein